MATRILRYVSVGLVAATASLAWADNMYMFSQRNGMVYFGSAPASPRYAPRSKPTPSPHPPRRLLGQGAGTTGPVPFPDKSRFDFLVSEVARGYELDSALLHAVITVESRYNPSALSPAGAIGLMQLMPATAKRYGVSNAFDPEQNLRAGAQYLRDLLSMFGSDIRLALAAYHAGEYAIARNQNRIPPFSATMDFVTRVLEHYQRYRASTAR